MSNPFANIHEICTKKRDYEWEENEYKLVVCFAKDALFACIISYVT